MNTHDVLIVGHAKVPSGSALHSSGRELLTICLRVDPDGMIAEADSTVVTGVLHRWLEELLVGRDFAQPIDDVLGTISANFMGAAEGPIRQALIDAWRRYNKSKDATKEVRGE